MNKELMKTLALLVIVATVFLSGELLINKYSDRSVYKTVAVINGEKIKLKDIDGMITYLISNLKSDYGESFEKEINKLIKYSEGAEKERHEKNKKILIDSRNKALDEIVRIRVLSRKGRQLNMDAAEDEEQLMRIMDNIRENSILTSMKEGISREVAEGIFDAHKDEFMSGFYQKDKREENDTIKLLDCVVISEKMKTMIYNSIEVSDEEIKKYYDDNRDEYVRKAGYGVFELFFPIINGNRSDAELAAQDIFWQMSNKNPDRNKDFETTFDEAANNNHELSSVGKIIAQKNTVTLEDSNRPQTYLESIKNLKIGEYCAPIAAEDGYYIPFVVSVRESDEIRTLEEKKDSIISTLKNSKKENELYKKLEEYKKEFKVKIYEDNLSF